MTTPCIVCVAITGSVATKADNRAVPVTVAEQIESAHAAFEAGASICHAHVRGKTRGGMLPLRPDMASLSVGSNNFPARVYENPPDLVDWLAVEMIARDIKPEIEAFDLSHIFHAAKMHEEGKIRDTPYVQFVMGVRNAMPADREVFDFYVATVRRLFGPDSPWCAAGVGANQIRLNVWAIAAGGHVRTGLEDNVRLDRDRLAPSNAALVRRAVDHCEAHGRPVATPAEARAILGLRPG